MAVAVNLWLKLWGLSNIVAHGATANDFTRFPAEVTNDRAQRILEKCHQTVLGISQWSLGRKPPGGRFSGMGPTPFQDYYKQIRDMLLLLRGFEIPNLFLRSVHHNPLGNLKTTCPPEDWRYPATVDMYNEIHRNLTAELGVPFLDTSDIIGPMWDSAHDFCHYRNDETSRAEALFVLGEVLGSGG